MGWATVISAVILATVQLANLVVTVIVRRAIKIPSGGTIGEWTERAHNLTAATLMGSTWIAKHISDEEPPMHFGGPDPTTAPHEHVE